MGAGVLDIDEDIKKTEQSGQEITWEMLLEKYKDNINDVRLVKLLRTEGYKPEIAADMMFLR